MPRRNTRDRRHLTDHHIYNREKSRGAMFVDDRDRKTFRWMIKRYLSIEPHYDARGNPYPNHRSNVALLAFALMETHFHLILRQLAPGGLEAFMRPLMSSYVRYFNRRHAEGGAMFNGRYRAAPKIDARARKTAIAYVHDNHGASCECGFCSSRYYADPDSDCPSWIDVDAGLRLFGGREAYSGFRGARAYLL